MKKTAIIKYFTLLISTFNLLVSCKKDKSPLFATESFTVTVNNGYGSGTYKAGDTVHVWSTAMANTQVFDNWSGYDNLLENKGEWHNIFIMPSQNVTLTATLKTVPTININFERIKGANILKNVHYFFPPNHKGMVFLLHGTGGNAQNWISGFEYRAMLKDLIADNFAVVVTEAEEISLNQDLNGDGKLRWAIAPLDSVANIDLANIKAITDTFYARGITTVTKPRFSIGMSNGSSFSGSLSALYKFKAAAGYCAPLTQAVVSNTLTPFLFCMATNDANENVGPAGNASALTQQQAIGGRGICSKYTSHNASPLYAERFARTGDITIAVSTTIFTEFKNAGLLNAKNYFVKTKAEVLTILQSNASAFPTLNGLTASQKASALNQLEVTLADHEFFSDYNRRTINFLNNQCQ
jgi:predicted esterase